MSREEAIDLLDNLIGMVEDNHESDYDTALRMGIKALEYDDAKYHAEHGEVIVDNAVWEDAKRALEQEPAYCDRNICIKNEYNGIGCDECEVIKSQESCEDAIIGDYNACDCNTCIYKDERDSGECYECVKGIQNWYEQADGEYISKEKAIIQLSWDLSEVELPRIKESLDKLPSVAIPSAEPKTGHWEVMYEPKNMVVCSKCGKCAYLYNDRGSAYCPHCGDYKGGK